MFSFCGKTVSSFVVCLFKKHVSFSQFPQIFSVFIKLGLFIQSFIGFFTQTFTHRVSIIYRGIFSFYPLFTPTIKITILN